MSETIDNIVNYLGDHRYLTLATVSPDGEPMAATVSYANSGTIIFVSTGRTTDKFKNIGQNPRVALTVDEDYDNWGDIRGVQIRGTAELLDEGREMEAAKETLSCKFPQMAHMPKNVNFAFFKIVPTVAYYLDNSKGFGHRNKVVF
jgi:uncharacterized protein YhbP (UPF0306 family)